MKPGKLRPETFLTEEFDIITSFEETRLIYKFLRKGGLFYCTTPNFNSYLRYYLKEGYNIIAYPEHLSYYTRRTLKKLLKERGFKSSKILTTGISITRFKTSKKTSNEKPISEKSQDERLRQQISSQWYLGYLKTVANYLLTIFGLGMTLKGYFIKK